MRNPFRRAETPQTAASDPTLRELVSRLNHDVSGLQSELAAIRFEWAEVLDKINRWSAREAARRRRDVNAALSDQRPQGDPDPAPAGDRAGESKLALWRKANQA